MSTTNRSRPVTLSDVAEHAGVSQSTASRVLNGSARAVGQDLTRRVMRAAAELDYATNTHAQAIARGTTTTVAVLLTDIGGAYFSSMASALMRSAQAAGLRISIGVTQRSIEREIELIREHRAQKARAIVLAESGYRTSEGIDQLVHELQTYEQTGGTVVIVSRSTLPFDFVDLDNFGGARRLAVGLARLGYERFLVLAGDLGLVATHDRVEGFRAGLAERDITLDADSVIECEFSWEGARRLMSVLPDDVLERSQVLFAVNDEMALGAIAGLRERGLRIPEDIAIAGYDDIRSLRDVVPGLTTVHVPIEDVGREVIAHVTGHKTSPATLPATVVLRGSTPPLHAD